MKPHEAQTSIHERSSAGRGWRLSFESRVLLLSLLGGSAGTEDAREEWAIVDWLVPPAEPEVGELLLRAAVARAHGARRLVLRLPPWSPWFGVFQVWGFLVAPARRFLLVKSFLRKLDDLWLRDSWWTTLSDDTAV